MKLTALDWIALILVIVGGLNWGLVGLFDFNLVEWIFGEDTALTNIVYVVVGISALLLAFVSPSFSRNSQLLEDRDR